MVLKGKSLIITGIAALVALVAILFLTSRVIILEDYKRLETRLVMKNVTRALGALSNELANLESTVIDWSEWDDTWAFVAGSDPEYVKKNLSAKTFSGLNLSYMIFMDAGGRVVYGKKYDREEDRLTPIPQSMEKHLAASGLLHGFSGSQKGTTGLILLPEGALLACSHAILPSDGEGPRRGTVVFGRYLDATETEKLSKITQLNLSFPAVTEMDIPGDIRTGLISHSGDDPSVVRRNNEESITGYGVIKDIYGSPILFARVDSAREVYESGRRTVMYFMAWITLIGIIAFLTILKLVNKLLLAREERQKNEMRFQMEQEMLKAQKLESLGVLAGGIAHDFNNLLTGILGNISLAKLCLNPDDKATARLEEAERASERAGDLTQQLLTFSKGGAPVKKTASIDQLIRDSVCFALRGANVRCEFSISEGLWPVLVDYGQISRAINNLAINACQAMPGGGTIIVCAENAEICQGEVPHLKEGRYARISISDHGVGISQENLQKIFDPYFTTKPKGSGLGLATVYSILKNHDGCIAVESNVGTGTVFTLFLPAPEHISDIQMKPESAAAVHRGKGKILIMDDEENIREILSKLLDHLGYEVVTCGDGDEAVSLYGRSMGEREPFDAVIMDLTVPGGVGGKETMEKLLAIDPGARGIVSSGYSTDPVLACYRDYGFCGILPKPYKAEGLGEILRSVLKIK